MPNNPQAARAAYLLFKVIGVFPLLLGLGLLAGGWFSAKRQYTILKDWPTVDAVVMRSELVSRQERMTHNRLVTLYQAHIDFRYAVAGKQYTAPAGSDFSSSNYAEMKRRVEANAAGTHRSIRYDPANPYAIRYDAGYTFAFFLGPLTLLCSGLMSVTVGVAFFILGSMIGKGRVQCPACGKLVGARERACPYCGAGVVSYA